MMRLLLGALAAATLLLVPATAQGGDNGLRIRGTVALKDTPNHVVTLRTSRQAVGLSVPGSLALIRVGQRVELRGSTLRRHGHRSRVLARNVTVVSTQVLANPSAPIADDDDEVDDDEVEIKGTLTTLTTTQVTVRGASRTVTCAIPAGTTLVGFAVNDFVEITCDLKAGAFVLRVLKHEDDDENEERADDDNGGHGGNSGPGHGGDDDDHDDHDNSGPGGGGGSGHG